MDISQTWQSCTLGKSVDTGARNLGLQLVLVISSMCYLGQAVLASLSLSFFVCKIGMYLKSYCYNLVEFLQYAKNIECHI